VYIISVEYNLNTPWRVYYLGWVQFEYPMTCILSRLSTILHVRIGCGKSWVLSPSGSNQRLLNGCWLTQTRKPAAFLNTHYPTIRARRSLQRRPVICEGHRFTHSIHIIMLVSLRHIIVLSTILHVRIGCGKSWVLSPSGSNQRLLNGCCCFSAKHIAYRSESKDWLRVEILL
jgi:hypothetical protein